MSSLPIAAEYCFAVLPVLYVATVPLTGTIAAVSLILLAWVSSWKIDKTAAAIILSVNAALFTSTFFVYLLLAGVCLLCFVIVGDFLWGKWIQYWALRQLPSQSVRIMMDGDGELVGNLKSEINKKLTPHINQPVTFVSPTGGLEGCLGLVVLVDIPVGCQDWKNASSVDIEQYFNFKIVQSFIKLCSSSHPQFVVVVIKNFPKPGSSPLEEAAATFTYAMVEAIRSEILKDKQKNIFVTTVIGTESDTLKSAQKIASSLYQRRNVYLPWFRCADRFISLMASRRAEPV